MNLHPNSLTSRREFIRISTAATLGGALASFAPAGIATLPGGPTAERGR